MNAGSGKSSGSFAVAHRKPKRAGSARPGTNLAKGKSSFPAHPMDEISSGRRSLDETIASLPSLSGSLSYRKSDPARARRLVCRARGSARGPGARTVFHRGVARPGVDRAGLPRSTPGPGAAGAAALKIIDSSSVNHKPEARDQFWAECSGPRRTLVHPHVVTVHNLGTESGFDFIEMEYISRRRNQPSRIDHQGRPDRADAGLRPGPAGRSCARGSTPLRVGPPRCQAGQCAADPAGRVRSSPISGWSGISMTSRWEGLPSRELPTFMAPELFQGTPASPHSDFSCRRRHVLLPPVRATAVHGGQHWSAHRAASDAADPQHPRSRRGSPQLVVNVLERTLAKKLPGSVTKRPTSSPEDLLGGDPSPPGYRDPGHRERRGARLLRPGRQGPFPDSLPTPRGPATKRSPVEVNEGKNHDPYLSVFGLCPG